jgi:eukaryotic-like serine/threonine-protein kinase
MTRDTTDALRAALLPELELIRPLGRGTTAEVFLAREPALQRLVAVKVLRPELSEDPVVRQRFQREAQSAARIMHPHVTTIYRTGCTPDQRPFIVMEYVEGRTLADVLESGGPMDPAAARPLLASIAGALAAAHARGIIHRDVRPGSVLVENRTGRAVLGDFGLAALLETGSAAATRLTSAGVILGDMRYRSPEQVRGDDVVEQSDVYAFGILAFELLTGRLPYTANSQTGWMTAHLSHAPADLRDACPAAGEGLAALVGRCLAKDPARRPLAAELVTRLEGSDTVPGERGPMALFLSELQRRRVYQVMAAYTAVAVALIGVLADVSDAIAISLTAHRIIVVVALAGFPLAFLLAWVYDVRAGGIEKTRGPRGAGTTRPLMWAGAAGTLLIALLAGWLLLR